MDGEGATGRDCFDGWRVKAFSAGAAGVPVAGTLSGDRLLWRRRV